VTGTGFRVGWAKVDITGEPWGVGMMGYGMPEQRSTGLLTRQYARAFVFAAAGPDHAEQRIAYVVADIGMFFQAAVEEITDRLARRTGGRLSAANVVLTATHTHCGPGGHGRHALYNFTTGGFHRRTFRRLVDGVVRAVAAAEDALAPAELALARGELRDASINRSASSFDRNPEAVSDRFPDRIDPVVTVLRIEREGRLRAVIDWFAVHCTSMTNTNTLISADNKGWAAAAWERERPGTDFVAAFAQTNSGDMSPNLHGSAGHGPTDDERVNTAEIGRRQLDKARELVATPGERLPAVLDHRLMYVDFGRCRTADGPTGRAVLGTAFAAGTDDGRGAPIFNQGLELPGPGDRVVGALNELLYRRFPGLAARHAPKRMLLPIGALHWAQEVLPVQLVRIGSLHLLCLPVEVTVTAGARLRAVVAAELGIDDTDVLVQGYANGYAHYLTTPQEYDAQRYEAGSTVFGRNQLAAFCEAAARLARSMSDGVPAPDGAERPRHRIPWPHTPFGSALLARAPRPRVLAVRSPAVASAAAGERAPSAPVLEVEFLTGHPNAAIPDRYLRIDREAETGWTTVADDDHPDTRIAWRRRGAAFAATVTWENPEPGRYRVGIRGPADWVFSSVIEV
jgi:neutral ceramidase